MKPTKIAVLVFVLALIGWEVYAIFDPVVWTISKFVWSVSVDMGMAGAPVVFLIGFLMGHWFFPRNLDFKGVPTRRKQK